VHKRECEAAARDGRLGLRVYASGQPAASSELRACARAGCDGLASLLQRWHPAGILFLRESTVWGPARRRRYPEFAAGQRSSS